jgi:hypothetical protein
LERLVSGPLLDLLRSPFSSHLHHFWGKHRRGMNVIAIYHQSSRNHSFQIADDPFEARQEANSGLEVRCA